jgi:hypothetical protein
MQTAPLGNETAPYTPSTGWGGGVLLFFIKYMKSTLSTHGATCKTMFLIENIIFPYGGVCMTTNISDAKSYQKIRMMTSLLM